MTKIYCLRSKTYTENKKPNIPRKTDVKTISSSDFHDFHSKKGRFVNSKMQKNC